MDKFQISVMDFMVETGKHFIGEKDKNNKDLCVGDVVEYNGGKFMIVYRYGNFHLKKPMSVTTIITDFSHVKKLNEVWSTPDYMACGMKTEPFFQKVKHLFK